MAEEDPHPPRLPIVYGPARAPRIYDLQNRYENHGLIGDVVTASHNRWLHADEITSILQVAESQDLPVSFEQLRPTRGVIGLFVFRRSPFLDQRGDDGLIWNGPMERFTTSRFGFTVSCAQAICLQNNQYRKRQYRNFTRFGRLVVVHYSPLALQVD